MWLLSCVESIGAKACLSMFEILMTSSKSARRPSIFESSPSHHFRHRSIIKKNSFHCIFRCTNVHLMTSLVHTFLWLTVQASCLWLLEAFSPLHPAQRTRVLPPPTDVATDVATNVATSSHCGPLYSGDGIAETYQWHEDAFELEVTVKVPKQTLAKDIIFKAKKNSIDLRLKSKKGDDDSEHILLDVERPLRGTVALDGTFWVITDPDKTNNAAAEEDEPYREVTVTIEKEIRTPKDDFDVIDYDWKGVYKNDEEEVSFRKYDEPEELNVREYAASLGVDIDNLNMSLVDKSMFTSGLNLTKSSLDSLRDSGLMKEVTQQHDGSEWETSDEGAQVPFSSYGRAISKDEAQSTATKSESDKEKSIPFLDTDSPWHSAVPVDQRKKVAKEVAQNTTTATKTSKQMRDAEEMRKQLLQQREKDAIDPISTLTVTKLRDILRGRGLKVSGNKKELQERLRAEVNSLLQGD